MTAQRPLLVTLAVAAGLTAGWTLSRRYLRRHREALFSPKLRRRHAALGYLAGRPTPETWAISSLRLAPVVAASVLPTCRRSWKCRSGSPTSSLTLFQVRRKPDRRSGPPLGPTKTRPSGPTTSGT